MTLQTSSSDNGEGDVEGLLRQLKSHQCNGWSNIDRLMDQAASAISKLKGERDEARKHSDMFAGGCGSLTYQLAAAEARAQAAEQEIGELREVWDWLATRCNLELDWDEIDEGEAAWRVHRVSGNRSDREWELIATGETPLEAVRKARALLSSGGAGEGNQGVSSSQDAVRRSQELRPDGREP